MAIDFKTPKGIKVRMFEQSILVEGSSQIFWTGNQVTKEMVCGLVDGVYDALFMKVQEEAITQLEQTVTHNIMKAITPEHMEK